MMHAPSKFQYVLGSLLVVACGSDGDSGLFDEQPSGGGLAANGGKTASGPSSSGGTATGGTATGGSTTAGGSELGTGGTDAGSKGGQGATTGGSSSTSGGSHSAGGQTNAGSGGAQATAGGTSVGGTSAGAPGPSTGGGAAVTGGNHSGGALAAGGKPPIATGGTPSISDCPQARAAVMAALDAAQACKVGEEDQCQGFVAGECCEVAVNDPGSKETAAYSAALAQWNKACGGAVCLAVLCAAPQNAVCRSQGMGSGRCMSSFDPLL